VKSNLRVAFCFGCVRAGRESLFELDPKLIKELREYLDLVSEQWDLALGRLRSFVEE